MERRSYDAWGKRRNINGTSASNAFVTSDVRHAFGGHEDLGEVGLIHMNGRLYDPATGRFISADPTIEMPDDMQNYNRYSYINNNPLSAIDYSGYGFLKSVGKIFKSVGKAIKSILKNKVIRTIAAIVVAVYAPEFSSLFGVTNPIGVGAIGGFTSGLVGSGGDLRAAISGALTAGAFGVAGDITNTFGNIAAHAAIGCASAVAGGGRCGSGALSGGFSAATAGFASGFGRVGGTVISSVIGGTASVLGGGKFENGAMTGAFGYLFNCMAHLAGCGGPPRTDTRDAISNERIGSLDISIRSDSIGFINSVHSELGVDLRVTQGLRTIDEQNNLYAQGRTRSQLDAVGLTDVQSRSGNIVTNAYGTQSYHTSGMAFDTVRLTGNGGVSWTRIDQPIANIGTRYGFQWGGNWRRPDYPHFERR